VGGHACSERCQVGREAVGESAGAFPDFNSIKQTQRATGTFTIEKVLVAIWEVFRQVSTADARYFNWHAGDILWQPF
jgi:hypothetical protein